MAKTKYPITKRDKRGNLLYIKISTGDWIKREFDNEDNETYYEDSFGNKSGTPKAEQGKDVASKASIKSKLTNPYFISIVSFNVSLISLGLVSILGFLTFLLLETR